MARASQATINVLTTYFDAMEAKDAERLGCSYAEDITLTFANTPTITGREKVLARMVDLLERVRSLAHKRVNVWEEDGGVVIFEVVSIWILNDGRVISINACSVFTLVDSKFVDQRIYVDNAPLDKALGEHSSPGASRVF